MMSEEPQSSGSEAVTSVVGRLLQHIVALLEARVDLTRQEMRASLRDVAIALFLLIAGLALLLLMIPVLVAVLILVLAQVVAPWLATAIVLAGMLAIAAVLLLVGRRRRRRRACAGCRRGPLARWPGCWRRCGRRCGARAVPGRRQVYNRITR